MHLLQRIKINPAYPQIGRAASRSVVRGVNFAVIQLAQRHLRLPTTLEDAINTTSPQPYQVDPMLAKYGNTLDARNEADEATRGKMHEDIQRMEQGSEVEIPPLDLAAQLLVVRNSVALDLLVRATRRKNPLDPRGGWYYDPFEIGETLETTFLNQLNRAPRINEAQIKAQHEALGIKSISQADLKRIAIQQQTAGINFLKSHKTEIVELLSGLTCRRPRSEEELKEANLTVENDTGIEVTLEDADLVFDNLPVLNQARMYVDAEMGLWFERDNAIRLLGQRHPDAMGNYKLVQQARKELIADFDFKMKHGMFKAKLDAAHKQSRGRYPTMHDLEPTPVQEPVTA